MRRVLAPFVILAALLSCGKAQTVPFWGQCGGLGYTGATTCDSGSTCVSSHQWYSQCWPIPLVLPTSSVTSRKARGLAQIKYLFTFGDSYTDTLFNINGPLAGPANSNPLGNPTFPGITSAGGTNWVGYLISTLNKTRTFSYNYAFSGATLDSALTGSSAVSVRSQIELEFLPVIGKKPATVPWTAAESLFVIFDGINDVFLTNTLPNQSSVQAPFFTLYNNLINELYNVGARHFLLVGVPAIDLTPLYQLAGAPAQCQVKSSLQLWNDGVKNVMDNIIANHTDATARYVDMDSLFRFIVANPSSVGVGDALALWNDWFHPVSAVHLAMAQTIANILE